MNASLKFLRELPSAHRAVFLAAFAAALLFAAFTNHVWEDYYITYRTSKNLATGHGLVFNVGDRLHTFTSPLGVLLPALASALTLNSSDTAALWIFRVLSAAAFAGAATLLYGCLLSVHRRALVATFAVGWLAFDAKALDFTINGMETGFLLLFVAWTLWAQFGDCSRRWLWLGLGWAGLMWTRPDGFLYIGLLAAGAFLFNDAARSGLTRLAWLKLFLFAGLVCTAVYLPWFLGSWAYYGTPVPHTITAKAGLANGPKTLLGAARFLLVLPARIWSADTSFPAAFLPSYYMMGAWPAAFLPIARALAFVAAFAWVAPFFSSLTRTASLAFFGLHFYLSYFPYFPFPWYLPGPTLLAYVALAGIAASIASPRLKSVAAACGVLLVGFNLWSTFAVAHQVTAQQKFIENGNRRKIGEWLRAHAAPGDTVFLEPLGYIGYFSNLKTYDFPGMSSREMPAAIAKVGADWSALIDLLAPDWLVLRPHEARRIDSVLPGLLPLLYVVAHDFDVRPDLAKLSVHGLPYLEFDSRFTVYRRLHPRHFKTEILDIRSRFPTSSVTISAFPMLLVHAPATTVVRVPPGATQVHVAFGFPDGAFDDAKVKTDGARFEIKWVSGDRTELLLSRQLDPAAAPADRGAQHFEAALPPASAPAELLLTTQTGPTDTRDWTSWAVPDFR